jgi:hypothetical protein
MNNEPTEFSGALACPRCGRSLTPVPMGTDVTFHCKTGHELPLAALLAAPSSTLRFGLEALIEEWDRQQQLLWATSEDAKKRGYGDIAAIFARRARSIEFRVLLLRAGVAKTESDRFLAVPARVRLN